MRMTVKATSSNLGALVLTIVIVYVILAIIIVIRAYDWTISVGGTKDEFTKVAAIWITLLTGLLTAFTSILILQKQLSAAHQLETLKAELNTDLEFLKGRFSAERKAYDELFGAACIYYYTLARLEVGAWDEVRAHSAEDVMLAACRYTISIDYEHRNLWVQIWQRARVISETAETLKDQSALKQLWKDSVKDFGALLCAFQKVAVKKHTSYESSDGSQ